MKSIRFLFAVTALSGLSACMSSSSQTDAGQTTASGFARTSDTLGTQRRVDVYGGSTSPVLPTMGAPGFGK